MMEKGIEFMPEAIAARKYLYKLGEPGRAAVLARLRKGALGEDGKAYVMNQLAVTLENLMAGATVSQFNIMALAWYLENEAGVRL